MAPVMTVKQVISWGCEAKKKLHVILQPCLLGPHCITRLRPGSEAGFRTDQTVQLHTK